MKLVKKLDIKILVLGENRLVPSNTVRFLPLLIVFSLLQKNLDENEMIDRLKGMELDESDDYRRIRCPHCNWQPKASSRWFCSDCDHPEYFYNGCGSFWNTFDTEGICPGCSHKWRWTSCLDCGEWALHKDWYQEPKQD